MDGSSGPKKDVPQPAAKVAQPAATTKGSAAAGKTRPEAASASGESRSSTATAPREQKSDDPFHVAPQPKRKVIALRPKPTAKTMHRVVCPMCDTPGFGSTAIAGKEVKCANPKCLMPIFTAPEIKKEAPPPPPKPLITPLRLTFAGVALLLIAGGTFYALVLHEPKPELPNIAEVDNSGMQQPAPVKTEQKAPVAPPEPPKMPISELQEIIFKSGVDAARQRDDNRSKEFCRMLTATAFAQRGQIPQALEQLQAFDNLRSGLDFMKITPLTRIAWHHLEQGNRAQAEKVAAQALEFAGKLPQSGADAVQQAVVLGTLLIALEKYDDALKLIEARESIQEVAQSAARVSMVTEDTTFNLERSYGWLPRVDLVSPLSFAATYGATVRGYDDQARQWIEQVKQPERKAICAAGFASALAMRANLQETSFSADAIENLPGITEYDRTRALTLALLVLQRDVTKQAFTDRLLQQLSSTTEAWERPTPVEIPDYKAIYEGKFPTLPPHLTTAVQSLMLEARALARSGQSDAAWKHVEWALEWIRALGPAHQEAETLTAKLDQERSQMEARLGRDYEITRDDLKRAAFNQYRKNARTLEEMAQRRLEMEKRLLAQVLDWGLAPQLHAAYQQNRAAGAESTQRNLVHVVESTLGPELAFALNEAGQADQSRALREQLSLGDSKSKQQQRQQIERLLRAGQVQQAHELYRSMDAQIREPLQFVRWSCLLAEQASPEILFDWLIAIPDPIEKELAMRLTAAQHSQQGKIREFWKISETKNLSATQKCARNLGLLEGLSHTDAYPPESPAPATDPEPAT